MTKWIQYLAIIMLLVSCKTTIETPKKVQESEPTAAYREQIENIKEEIYFRGYGNEPDWRLKISKKAIEFTSLKAGFEALAGNHVEPILAMDANVKMYRLTVGTIQLIIQIMQQECVNSMSGEKAAYSVRIEMIKDNQSTFINGCGNYVTDTQLHDIWVLEKLNGEKMYASDFSKELPNLEINSTTNQFMGYAGCNRMNGTIFFEKGLLRFTNVSTTRMMCGENNKENEFLKALQSTTTYKVGNLQLILTSPSGNELIFKKVD